MLTQLTINDYTIVDHLDLELQKGMTVITGETGAGKSIMLDAIGLALGDRADSQCVRIGSKRADICVQFDISRHKNVKAWLQENDLDDEHHCILRRVITKEGRSRGYINHQSVPLQLLRQLGGLLIDIHNQHQHQSLLKKEAPRILLDNFAQHQSLVEDVKHHYKQWQQTKKRLHKIQNQSDEQLAKQQLLTYQLEELDELNLEPGETKTLELEQKTLSQADDVLHASLAALSFCSPYHDDNINSGETSSANAMDLLNHALNQLSQLNQQINLESSDESVENETHPTLQAQQLFRDALVYVEEGADALQRHINQHTVDPQRLIEIEQRLSTIYDCARKHKVKPEELIDKTEFIRTELEAISHPEDSIEQLTQKAEQQKQCYFEKAKTLSQQRQRAAETLTKKVIKELHELGMPQCQFFVPLSQIADDDYSAYGLEEVSFTICTNAGQPAKPIHKIASGGELSRISLAIQVVTAQTSQTPTMIFDEVDVGIGGATAEKVGQLLQKLGGKGQTICVTHQPQVAAQGHQHLKVCKDNSGKIARTKIDYLSAKEKAEEVARMLGGIVITQQTLSHAEEMLSTAQAH